MTQKNASPQGLADLARLMRAVEDSDLRVAQAMLAQDPGLANALNPHGETPLALAARLGREAMVEFLLRCSKGQADRQDLGNRTPLMSAAQHGNASCVRLLWAASDRSMKNALDETALHLAAKEQHAECLEALAEHWPQGEWAAPNRFGVGALRMAGGSIACVRAFERQARSPIDWSEDSDARGGSALSEAAACGDAEAIRRLAAWSSGDDAGSVGRMRAAMAAACEEQQMEALLALLELASPTAREQALRGGAMGGGPLLCAAAASGWLDGVQLIAPLQPSALSARSPGDGQCPLQVALARRKGETAAWLCEWADSQGIQSHKERLDGYFATAVRDELEARDRISQADLIAPWVSLPAVELALCALAKRNKRFGFQDGPDFPRSRARAEAAQIARAIEKGSQAQPQITEEPSARRVVPRL